MKQTTKAWAVIGNGEIDGKHELLFIGGPKQSPQAQIYVFKEDADKAAGDYSEVVEVKITYTPLT